MKNVFCLPLNQCLYYKRDSFRLLGAGLLGGGWALGNFSHTMPVSRIVAQFKA